MHLDCDVAFKEWSVICEALASGGQSLILRKGGIHEGREGFRVAHQKFWLFPTYLHQDEREKLAVEAWPTLEQTVRNRPASDRIPLQYFVEVTDVIEIADEAALPRLAGLHWWSAQTVVERFHYRNPGVFLLVVRMFKTPAAVEIPNSPHFAGCRSWVDLPLPVPTLNLTSVLHDSEFETRRREILNAVLKPTV